MYDPSLRYTLTFYTGTGTIVVPSVDYSTATSCRQSFDRGQIISITDPGGTVVIVRSSVCVAMTEKLEPRS